MATDEYPKRGVERDPLRPPYDTEEYGHDALPLQTGGGKYPLRGLGRDAIRGSRADVAGDVPAGADGRAEIGWGYHVGDPGA